MILDRKISYFKNTTSTEVDGVTTIGEVLNSIKNGDYKKGVLELREGNSQAKKALPTFAMHGLFEFNRKKNNFYEASGIIILDIDDIDPDDIPEAKESIILESDYVLAAMTSPSGNGIKVLYYVDPELVTADNYRQIGKQIIGEFDTYGNHVDYLSVTDCLIATYDPDIYINQEVKSSYIYIKEESVAKVELEPRDKAKELWEDPEDFFDTVLAADIASKTNNNYHYIQVAVLDLAKFGFRHPQHDLSFVIDYSENEFRSSSENKRRFLEITAISQNYQQTLWPYRLLRDEEEDQEINYADFIDEDSIKIVENKDTDEGAEESPLVDYENLFDEMIDLINEGDRAGFEVSFENLADIFRFKNTGILTVTGIPTHGKTEMVDALTLDLARLYGHQTLVAGFEQTPKEHIVKLIRKLVGVDIRCSTWRNNESNQVILKNAYEFIITKFKHLNLDSTGGNINKILGAAAKQIVKSRKEGEDPKYMVLDPFNMLSIKGKYSGHEKIEEILRKLTHFSHQMGILVILVAHPFKMRKDEKTGEYEIPDFYSVKGSSAFFEMSFHGLTVYRKPDCVLVRVLKVKQNNLGEKDAEALFLYERSPGRYIPVDENLNELSGDHRDKNWLDRAINIKQKK